MDRSEITRAQVSALADGELDEAQSRQLLKRMNNPEVRAAWDGYHQIGDAIRSDDTASPLSNDFAARFSARLDAEPVLIAPKRGLLSSWRTWPAALAAVAAAAFGFYIAPGLMGERDSADHARLVQVNGSGRSPSGATVAETTGMVAVANTGAADYIRLHQSANPALYSMAPLVRPVVLDDSSER